MNSFTIKYNEVRPELIEVEVKGYGFAQSTMDNYNKWFVRKGMDIDGRIEEVIQTNDSGYQRDMYEMLVRLPHMVKAIVCGEWEGEY